MGDITQEGIFEGGGERAWTAGATGWPDSPRAICGGQGAGSASKTAVSDTHFIEPASSLLLEKHESTLGEGLRVA